jgi:hypothetical protein
VTAAAPRFGDAELSVLDYLSRHLADFQGSTDFPTGTPASPWIVARRYGGNYRPPAIDYARLSLEAWAASRFDAQARLQEAIGALLVAGRLDTTPRDKDGIPLPRIVRTFVESAPVLPGVNHRLSTVDLHCRGLLPLPRRLTRVFPPLLTPSEDPSTWHTSSTTPQCALRPRARSTTSKTTLA